MNSDRVRVLITLFSDRRVGVVGDLMLDRYVWGSARRISQEAPVPVVEVSRTSVAPGGAANVARNLAALGAGAMAYGVVGEDGAGTDLLRCLTGDGVDVTGVVCDAGRVTTEKTRVIAGHQQVVRVDTERIASISPDVEQQLLKRIDDDIESGAIDGIILEDYAKGTITEGVLRGVVERCRARGVPVALDPHPANRARATGVSVITPNRAEAYAMAGVYASGQDGPAMDDESFREVVRSLQETWAPKCLLITLGAEGMALFRADAPPLHIPTRAREVFDVSGAGDTVVATYLLAVASGATAEEAAHLANHAAGVVVGKLGTASVSPEELAASFDSDGPE